MLLETDFIMASSIFGYFLLFTFCVVITTEAHLPTKDGLEDSIRGQIDSKREKRSPIPSQSDLAEEGKRALAVLLKDARYISATGNTIRFHKFGGHVQAYKDFNRIATHIKVVSQDDKQTIWAQAGDRKVIVENSKMIVTIKLIKVSGTGKTVIYIFTYFQYF